MIIYDNNGKLLLDIPVDDNSCRYRAIGQAKKVELHYSLPGHMELPMGSFIEYQGERYTLWSPSDIEKKGTRNLSYKVIFSGEEEVLKKYKYKQLSDKPFKLKFPLTAKPIVFVQLLVENLNLHDSGWEVGQVIESAEKLMSFNHENCWSVLGRLAQEFDTEFEIKGKKINLQKVRYFEDSPVKLSYGKGNGFVPGVGRTNQGDNLPVEIVYVQGGEKNVNNSTYGSKTLLLPKSQELDYEGHRYKTDVDGMYITRADKDLSSRNEDSYDASHIYPTRVGVISSVEMVPGKDSEGNPVTFYNIVDNKIPEALNYRDCRLDGNKATIIFQSGKLAGREFDIMQTDKVLTGYDHATKTFKLVSAQEDGETLPNETFCPLAGDEYAVFNISLPKAYVCDNDTKTGASWDMFREAARYLREHEERQFTFKGELDGIWAKKNWLAIGGNLIPGGYVDFSDTQFQPDGVLIRITGVRDYINRPHSPELELSNAPVSGFLSDSLGKLEAEEVRNDQKNKDSISFTKRSFRDAKETMGMLADALLTNFTESINPIAIATMQMLVGDESLQFRFVNSKTNPVVVPHNVTYNDVTKILSSPAGILQHMTIGVKEISSTNKYKLWSIGSYDSPPLVDAKKKYYLYAKCNKDNENAPSGIFLVADKAIALEQETGYYHFLVGVLNSEYDGVRSYVSLYGFTEILPGRITTDKIVSSDGRTYFDLANNEIGGKITFTAGSSGLDNITEWPAAKKAIEEAQSAANDANQEIEETGKALSDFKDTVNGAFKDGIIDTAEAKAIEKYINTLDTEKADADAVYNKLYANEYLTDTAKTELSNSKSTYNDAHTNLINSVKTAIKDGKTTKLEKADVDDKFVLYRSAIADYKSKVEAANKAIQDNLKGYSDSASSDAERNAKDKLAKGLGYDSYETMEAKAEAGATVIKGGKINTSLIEAKDIFTTTLLAELIKTTSLIAEDMTVSGGSIGGFAVNDAALVGIPDKNPCILVGSANGSVMINGSTGSIDVSCRDGSKGIIIEAFSGSEGLLVESSGSTSTGIVVNSSSTGMIINSKGINAVALLLAGGCIAGLKAQTRRIVVDHQISNEDVFLSCSPIKDISLYLPPSPQLGEMKFIRRNNGYRISVSGNGNLIRQGELTNVVDVGEGLGDMGLFFFDGQYWNYNVLLR